jgi:cobalt-zinc-cadmium efflux system outer membrane protein
VLTASEDADVKPPEDFVVTRLLEQAAVSRPDLKKAVLDTDFSGKSLQYEKARRTPGLTLNASYDRAGGVMNNFVGFGAAIDLPFFDRNRGAIKAAQISLRQSQAIAEQKHLEVCNEVVHAMQNYILAYDFNRQINREFIANLDEMMESYTRNFVDKNIGIVEFLDFFDAWTENKRTMLSARKNVTISFEELQYAVGTELQSLTINH